VTVARREPALRTPALKTDALDDTDHDDLTAVVIVKCEVADLRYAFKARSEPWRNYYPRTTS
jgi:hypothetical protein